LILTPHLGSGTRQTRKALTRAAVEKVLVFERRPALDGA
jgi:lactate dehydrogenase-like 2-hydroxyacid dehydrogenase